MADRAWLPVAELAVKVQAGETKSVDDVTRNVLYHTGQAESVI